MAACERCGLPVRREAPISPFDAYAAHEPDVCIRLLKARVAKLEAQIALTVAAAPDSAIRGGRV